MTGYSIKMVVACTNANGEPDLFHTTVQATQDEVDDGLHYEKAKSEAEGEAYEPPFVAFEQAEFLKALAYIKDDLGRGRQVMTRIDELIERKKQGIVPSEEESTEIKSILRDPIRDPAEVKRLAEAYPLEADEVAREPYLPQKTVYVVSWEYATGGGFNWHPSRDEGLIAFGKESVNDTWDRVFFFPFSVAEANLRDEITALIDRHLDEMQEKAERKFERRRTFTWDQMVERFQLMLSNMQYEDVCKVYNTACQYFEGEGDAPLITFDAPEGGEVSFREVKRLDGTERR